MSSSKDIVDELGGEHLPVNSPTFIQESSLSVRGQRVWRLWRNATSRPGGRYIRKNKIIGPWDIARHTFETKSNGITVGHDHLTHNCTSSVAV